MELLITLDLGLGRAAEVFVDNKTCRQVLTLQSFVRHEKTDVITTNYYCFSVHVSTVQGQIIISPSLLVEGASELVAFLIAMR